MCAGNDALLCVGAFIIVRRYTYRSWERQDVAELVHAGFRLVAAEGKAAAVAAIEKEIRAAPEIVVATDAGREGEMIAWELIGSVQRLGSYAASANDGCGWEGAGSNRWPKPGPSAPL